MIKFFLVETMYLFCPGCTRQISYVCSNWKCIPLILKCVACLSFCRYNSYQKYEIVQVLQKFFQGNSGKFLTLIVSELRYLGPVDLTQYYIKEYTFKKSNETLPLSPNGGKPVIIDIVFSRRIMNQILITFLPTACITITSFTTSFYKVQKIIKIM